MSHLEQQDEVMLDILRRMEGQHQVIMGKFGLIAPDADTRRPHEKKRRTSS